MSKAGKQHGQTVRRDPNRRRKDGSDHRHVWETLHYLNRKPHKCSLCGLTAHRESQHPSYAKAEKQEQSA